VKVYDNALDKKTIQELVSYDLGMSNAVTKNENNDDSITLTGVPLYIPFSAKGALFLELDKLQGNEELNLYFQLTPQASTNGSDESNKKNTIKYCCSGSNSWIDANVLSDGTHGFKCSGVLTLSIPEVVASYSTFMPTQNSWVSISVDSNQHFAGTIYVAPNGVELERSGTDYLLDTSSAPTITVNTITAPKIAIVGLTKVNQPFPSFGGRKAEDSTAMNERVSQRIATKDRAVSTYDYCSLIQQQFPEVFYSSVFFNTANRKTTICLVKKVSSTTDAQAFLPLIEECSSLFIKEYVKTKTSALAKIEVDNFNFSYVSVQADVVLKSGIAEGVKEEISDGINVFLSPWISSSQQQTKIHQEIKSDDVSNFISTYDEVEEVSNVTFKLFDSVITSNQELEKNLTELPKLGVTPSVLYVSALKHDLTKTQSS
jgi:hypothetical protein